MQKARSQRTLRANPEVSSYRLLACGFRISFTPRTGVLFTCPSRYSSTIGHTGVFSLGGWSPQLHARLLESGVTQELHYAVCIRFALPGSHRLWRPVPGNFGCCRLTRPWVLQPRGPKDLGLGLGPVRSPLLRTSRLISLPPGTEMFQFPGFALVRERVTRLAPGRVAPFGHPGINACVPLPLAYRSLPRPSSPPCAQASPTCFRSLDHICDEAEHARSTTSDDNLKHRNCVTSVIRHPTITTISVVKQRFGPTCPLRSPRGQTIKTKTGNVSKRATTEGTFRGIGQQAGHRLLIAPLRR